MIGIDHYRDQYPTLANSVRDAEAVAKLLQGAFAFDHVFTLYDEAATRDAIVEWLRDRLPAEVGAQNRLLLFFAGHGATREGAGGQQRGYLLPHDAEYGRYSDFVDMTEPARRLWVDSGQTHLHRAGLLLQRRGSRGLARRTTAKPARALATPT